MKDESKLAVQTIIIRTLHVIRPERMTREEAMEFLDALDLELKDVFTSTRKRPD